MIYPTVARILAEHLSDLEVRNYAAIARACGVELELTELFRFPHQPFDAGWPPIYKYDCLPDPPKFRNPFVWDGKSPRGPTAPPPNPQAQDPAALEECLRNLPQDSLEAESADTERQLKQWGSSELDPRR